MLSRRLPQVLDGRDGPVRLRRNAHGIPEIDARTPADLALGLGWVQACDRQLQTLLTRCLLQGRAAEQLAGDPALVAIDRFMRRLDLLPDPADQTAALEPHARQQLEAYAEGFNRGLDHYGTVFELRLMGLRPEPWIPAHSLLVAKAVGYIGLADAQGQMEKFLVQMIQNGVDAPRLRELFPYLEEEIDVELIRQVRLEEPLVPAARRWLGVLPRMNASNNWAVAGDRTRSGRALVCGDPHLEVNRLPAIWQELVMRLPEQTLTGAGIPGVPGMVIGRTRHLAWSATYAFMDMLDYRIEHCRDGHYRRADGWKPFRMRQEEIRVKKGAPQTVTVYENEHGVLEGDPGPEGYRLVLGWSGRRGCGAGMFNGLLGLPHAATVPEALALFRRLDAAAFNWVVGDAAGHIGYQMSGRCYDRPPEVSGLLPTPGWEPRYDPRGFVPMEDLPTQMDPAEGFIVTANQDLNHLGRARVINLPMGAYRAERIRQRLEGRRGLTAADMQALHFDLHSLQAEAFLAQLIPLLPDTPHGRLLAAWDRTYSADSQGATLFEAVYRALVRVVFGDGGLGREVVDHILTETGLFNDYYANLDRILLAPDSAWFAGRAREDLLRQALAEGLAELPRPYGETRQVVLSHLLFGGKLPRFLGFDRGPIPLPGSRATIPQGQIFRSGGRTTTFSPSYRFVADLGEATLHTNLAGGPSDRRFSRWYASDLENWIKGIYKTLG
jgi:penicillin amidase